MNNGGRTTSAETVQVGEMLDWIDQNNDMVGYIYVTGVNSQGVEVEMWVWAKD
jgi:hypothetical protein